MSLDYNAKVYMYGSDRGEKNNGGHSLLDSSKESRQMI